MDTDLLWWEAKVGFGQAPSHDEAGEQRSVWQSDEELEGEGESAEEAVEEQGEDEEEENKEEEKASDRLLHELWKDWRDDEKEIETRERILMSVTGKMVIAFVVF